VINLHFELTSFTRPKDGTEAPEFINRSRYPDHAISRVFVIHRLVLAIVKMAKFKSSFVPEMDRKTKFTNRSGLGVMGG